MREAARKARTPVYFIGAGPGNPELLTLKGKRLLKEAEVVLYAGSLIGPPLLGWARPGAELHDSASLTLPQIVRIMVDGFRSGKRVVRLHSGDPSLYSAMAEQMARLQEEDVPFEVVPGVSSASAAAARLKRELTLPELSQTVIFTRRGGRTPVPERERLEELARVGATMVIFLSVGMVEEVVKELSAGYPPDTPTAVVYRVGWEDEKIIRCELGSLAKSVKSAGLKRQALILVGRALGELPGKGSKLYSPRFRHAGRRLKP